MSLSDQLTVLKTEREALVSAVATLLGPVSTELGQYLADKVRVYRALAAARAIKRAVEMAKKESLPLNPSLKFLIPWLEGVSLENVERPGSDSVMEMWASLLAKQEQSEQPYDLLVIERLKLLTPEIAKFIEERYIKSGSVGTLGEKFDKGFFLTNIIERADARIDALPDEELMEPSNPQQLSKPLYAALEVVFQYLVTLLPHFSSYLDAIKIAGRYGLAHTRVNWEERASFELLQSIGLGELDTISIELDDLQEHSKQKVPKLFVLLNQQGATTLTVQYYCLTSLGREFVHRCSGRASLEYQEVLVR